MKVKLFFSVSVLLSCLFCACDTHVTCVDCGPAKDLRKYPNGVFVVNEGPFGGTGTISWYDPATGEVQDSIYEKANNGASLGQFVQSLTFHNGKAYIVVNGANRVVVADAETFEFIDTIGGLYLPRYFLPVSDGIGYVSQWGADGLSGSIARVDLPNTNVLKAIPVGSGPEKMVISDNGVRLFVANSGGFGVDSTVVTFLLSDETAIIKTVISGQRNPCCYGAGSSLYGLPERILCKGDWTNSASSGWIGATMPPFGGYSLPRGCDDLVQLNAYYYFSSGTAIYSILQNQAPQKLFDQAAYGLAVHPTTGDLYCADAKDFNSAGEVVIRKVDGTVVQRFRAGIAPGEIVIVE